MSANTVIYKNNPLIYNIVSVILVVCLGLRSALLNALFRHISGDSYNLVCQCFPFFGWRRGRFDALCTVNSSSSVVMSCALFLLVE